jgi:release factor glutamine methyltransferase
VSTDALDVARANASRLGLDVTFVEGDLTTGLEVDAVVSNPPYVEAGASLMPEVGRWEPPLALFGELDGLAVIRRLVAETKAPFLALEHGEGQADAIEALARAAGFGEIERVRDLAGIERVLVARR